MLNKSKLMLPILAAIVGIAASAFTVDFHAPKNINYFQYSGPNTAGYTTANNWTMSSTEPQGCSGGSKTCVVSSDTFTSTAALANYLQSHDPQSDGGSKYTIVNQLDDISEP